MMKVNNKHRFSRGISRHQKRLKSRSHCTRANVYSNTIPKEQHIIQKLSNEDRVNLFQRIEEIQGIRHSTTDSIVLPIDAESIVLKYQSLPVQKRKKYAELVKKALYYSVIKSIDV